MNSQGLKILVIDTAAFFVCFASWMIFGVLLTFLVKNRIFHWDPNQIGWLIGIVVLTGSLTRLPIGLATDHYGGRTVFSLLMFVSSGALFLLSFANSYSDFVIAGLLLGLTGASFAVGVAHIAPLFVKEKQGMALGIFGAGNLGAALTSFASPHLLGILTKDGHNLEGWRTLPQMYAVILLATALLFLVLAGSKKNQIHPEKSLKEHLAPLKKMRVWRFGFYYFGLFGGFVALSQWLIPYYVNNYQIPLKSAGILTALFSLSVGLIRPVGGAISDKWGARNTLYIVFLVSLVLSTSLIIPQLEVKLFTTTLVILGLFFGIGMAAVYKHIPVYFPGEVGVVGGLVSMIGGLGGFFLPILFGTLYTITGRWSSLWVLFSILMGLALVWMHWVLKKIPMKKNRLALKMEAPPLEVSNV